MTGRPPGRPRRIEEEQTERRRRRDDTLDRVHGRKLALPDECKDDKDHFYYWANDVDGRVEDLTVRDDFDKVILKNGQGDIRTVGTQESGQPLRAVLLRKPMEFHLTDQAKKTAARKANQQAFTKQAPVDPNNPTAAASTYVVEGSSIKSGAFAP